VAVLLCGQQLEIHRIDRDEDIIARLVVLETRFWEYVEKDIEPPRTAANPPPRPCGSCIGQ